MFNIEQYQESHIIIVVNKNTYKADPSLYTFNTFTQIRSKLNTIEKYGDPENLAQSGNVMPPVGKYGIRFFIHVLIEGDVDVNEIKALYPQFAISGVDVIFYKSAHVGYGKIVYNYLKEVWYKTYYKSNYNSVYKYYWNPDNPKCYYFLQTIHLSFLPGGTSGHVDGDGTDISKVNLTGVEDFSFFSPYLTKYNKAIKDFINDRAEELTYTFNDLKLYKKWHNPYFLERSNSNFHFTKIDKDIDFSFIGKVYSIAQGVNRVIFNNSFTYDTGSNHNNFASSFSSVPTSFMYGMFSFMAHFYKDLPEEFRCLSYMKGWGNEAFVLSSLFKVQSPLVNFLQNLSFICSKGLDMRVNAYKDMWMYHNLAIIEAYDHFNVFSDITDEFRDWIEANRDYVVVDDREGYLLSTGEVMLSYKLPVGYNKKKHIISLFMQQNSTEPATVSTHSNHILEMRLLSKNYHCNGNIDQNEFLTMSNQSVYKINIHKLAFGSMDNSSYKKSYTSMFHLPDGASRENFLRNVKLNHDEVVCHELKKSN
jgi:hypothetical protein